MTHLYEYYELEYKGFEGGGKMRVIRKMIKDKRINFVGLVESKCSSLNDDILKSLWGNLDCKRAIVDDVNRGWGLCCLWDFEFMQNEEVLIGARWICVKGVLKERNFSCAIILLYGPHYIKERRTMWREL